MNPPNRRIGVTIPIEVDGVKVHATANFDPRNGKLCEVFITGGGKVGSALALLMEDAAVIISIALQQGVNPGDLAKSVARIPAGRLTPSDLAAVPVIVDGKPVPTVPTAPATVLGAILTWLARVENNIDANAPGG